MRWQNKWGWFKVILVWPRAMFGIKALNGTWRFPSWLFQSEESSHRKKYTKPYLTDLSPRFLKYSEILPSHKSNKGDVEGVGCSVNVNGEVTKIHRRRKHHQPLLFRLYAQSSFTLTPVAKHTNAIERVETFLFSIFLRHVWDDGGHPVCCCGIPSISQWCHFQRARGRKLSW